MAIFFIIKHRDTESQSIFYISVSSDNIIIFSVAPCLCVITLNS